MNPLDFCARCGGPEITWLASISRGEFDVAAVRCDTCGWVISMRAVEQARLSMALAPAVDVVRRLRVLAGVGGAA